MLCPYKYFYPSCDLLTLHATTEQYIYLKYDDCLIQVFCLPRLSKPFNYSHFPDKHRMDIDHIPHFASICLILSRIKQVDRINSISTIAEGSQCYYSIYKKMIKWIGPNSILPNLACVLERCIYN